MSDIEGLGTQEEGKPADSWTRQDVGETLKNKWGSPGMKGEDGEERPALVCHGCTDGHPSL